LQAAFSADMRLHAVDKDNGYQQTRSCLPLLGGFIRLSFFVFPVDIEKGKSFSRGRDFVLQWGHD
jgi:hypothetical protein